MWDLHVLLFMGRVGPKFIFVNKTGGGGQKGAWVCFLMEFVWNVSGKTEAEGLYLIKTIRSIVLRIAFIK